MPSISVIVPVRNESRSIEGTLRVLLTQDFPRERFEVIVADGASTDETVPVVRRLQGEFENLKLVFNANRLSSAGRWRVFSTGHWSLTTGNYSVGMRGLRW